MLSPYRILDLTDEKGLMCGKLLGDLGAEVIKIEKPSGDTARDIGPFYHDIQDRSKSLFWFAFNTSKKGISLDIEKPKGKEIFKKLVKLSDCVIESFKPQYMDRIGLGYSSLKKVNQGIIVTSITPFGPSGPYKNYKASDLILWALSGLLFICGDPDRPPVRISWSPQAYLHSSIDAAVGTVMALYHRGISGEGQEVQISAQKSMERVAYPAHILWGGLRKVLRRVGARLKVPPLGTSTPLVWPCKDGYVAYYLFGGQMGTISNPLLTEWLDEDDLAPDYMKNMNWATFDIGSTPQKEIDENIVDPISKFFAKYTMSELWTEGLKRRVMVYPVNNADGVLRNKHLEERGFWVDLEHPELGDKIKYPGAFIKTKENLCSVKGRAPLIGEHNEEIYRNLLGFSNREIDALTREHII